MVAVFTKLGMGGKFDGSELQALGRSARGGGCGRQRARLEELDRHGVARRWSVAVQKLRTQGVPVRASLKKLGQVTRIGHDRTICSPDPTVFGAKQSRSIPALVRSRLEVQELSAQAGSRSRSRIRSGKGPETFFHKDGIKSSTSASWSQVRGQGSRAPGACSRSSAARTPRWKRRFCVDRGHRGRHRIRSSTVCPTPDGGHTRTRIPQCARQGRSARTCKPTSSSPRG